MRPRGRSESFGAFNNPIRHKKTVRKCLNCDKQFESLGIFNRLCATCRFDRPPNYEAKRPGAPRGPG